MTDDAADIRQRLHNLATLAPPGAGLSDPTDIVDLHRLQRRRRAGWACLTAAIALVVVGASTLLPRGPSAEPADRVASPSTAPTTSTDLYNLPPRGSLAADDDVLQMALAVSWDDGTWSTGGPVIDPPPDTRRVAFLGEVPGGQTWALVLGRVDDQSFYTWFADTDASDGITFERALGPMRAFPDSPMALLDDAGDSGPFVVVTRPGDEVQFSSTGVDQTTPPGYETLPTDDGVAVAEVPTPEYPSFSLGFRIVRDGNIVDGQVPQTFDSTQPLGPQVPYHPPADAPPVEEYGQRMANCLRPQGFEVTITSYGTGISFNYTQENEQAFDEAVDACLIETGYN